VEALTRVQVGLVRLSAAIAGGGAGDVTREAKAARADGAPLEYLYEAVLQSYLFVGFPRTIEAFFAVAPLLSERGARAKPPADPERWRRDGEALCRLVYGRNYEKVVNVIQDLSPDLAESMILEGYGKTLSRPGLKPVEREYAVVAILTVTRMWRQLRSHAIGAIHVGGTRAAVKESIALCEPWCDEAALREATSVTGLL